MDESLTTIGFDADDTLWQSEQFYRLTEDRFAGLLAGHGDGPDISARLLAAERRNLALYGYGVKGFTLSMIETALELTQNAAPGALVREILDIGREMLAHPVETLPGVLPTLEALAPRFRLVLVTKGDLFDQERKLAASGLGELFDAVEIVSDKTQAVYERVFSRHGDGPARAMMVGNSLKSDILPAIAAGSTGVFIPHDLTWVHEHAEAPETDPRFFRLERFADLLGLVDDLA
jgi:putative hydrolase of the HAD superfamily